MENDHIILGMRNKWADKISVSKLTKKSKRKQEGLEAYLAKDKEVEHSTKSGATKSKNSKALVLANTFNDVVSLRKAQKNFTLVERYMQNLYAENEIYEIKDVNDVIIDHTHNLSYKKGD